MAPPVVDLLEVVGVYHREREPPLAAGSPCHIFCQALLAGSAVVGAGQGVPGRELLQGADDPVEAADGLLDLVQERAPFAAGVGGQLRGLAALAVAAQGPRGARDRCPERS